MARDEGLEELLRDAPGWVRADAQAHGDDALRQRLVDAALVFVRSLPPKAGD